MHEMEQTLVDKFMLVFYHLYDALLDCKGYWNLENLILAFVVLTVHDD